MKRARNMIMMRRTFCLICAMLLLAVYGPVLTESWGDDSMRLLRCEGTMRIYDAMGESRFIMENEHFNSGDALETDAASTAAVSLDGTKTVTLDQESRVTFDCEDSHTRLALEKGTMLLDVREKLDQNETLSIETSTMTVDIRGTIAFLSEGILDGTADSEGVTRLGVLEGTARIDYTDSSGARRRLDVPTGLIATLGSAAEGGAAAVLTEMTAKDVEGFVENVIANDSSLSNRAQMPGDSGSNSSFGESHPVNGKGFSGTVTLVAPSASKLYDGQPLSNSNVLVYGLPADFTIQASAKGSQTEPGSTANVIDDYRIYNASNEDVTETFKVETVNGTLTVAQVPLTVWTGSAEKYYDGEPLTCPEAKLQTVSGHVSGGPEWRNTSVVLDTASGNEEMTAVSGNMLVQATNPLTGKTVEQVLCSGQKLTAMLHAADDGEGIEFDIKNLKEKELPQEVLRLFADNPDLLAQACKETEWDPDVLKALIAALPEQETGNTVTKRGLQLDSAFEKNVMWDSAYLRITVDSDIAGNDDRVIGSTEAEFTPIEIPASVSVAATGSQTEAGESVNTYEIDWGDANKNHYAISEDLGKLTVLPVHEESVVITACSSTRVYDRTPLSVNRYTVSGLPDGFRVSAKVTGSQTDAGVSDNVISSYQILDKDGADVTELFTNVSTVKGTLTVKPLELLVSFGGDGNEKNIYMGSPFSPNVVVTYQNGTHAGEETGGIRLNAGGPSSGIRLLSPRAILYFSFFTRDTMTLTVNNLFSKPGTYTYTGTPSFSCSSSNFVVSFTGQTITIEPAELIITTGSASKEYDGTALTNAEAGITGLADWETATITATGSQTEVGESKNTYTIDWRMADSDNYIIKESLGNLVVTKNTTAITITAASATKPYDGTPLTEERYTVDGLPDGFTCEADVTGSQTSTGFSDSKISSYAILNENEEDVTSFFENITTVSGTLTVTQAEVTVTTGSASKEYDGTALTSTEADITGLADGETATVTATGSQTEVGESENTYTIDWGTTDSGNYTIKEELGILTVTGRSADITITADSATKPYDGTPLTKDGYTVDGLPDGFTCEADVSGSQTSAGTGRNEITSYVIKDANQADVTSSFPSISVVSGTLEVTPAEATVTTGSASKEYDGTALTSAEADITGLADGETATVTATGSQTEVGESENTYTIDWGTADSGNYTIAEELGTLTVTENTTAVTITAASATKPYDGKPLTKAGYTFEGLPDGFTCGADVSGSQTSVGFSDSGISSYVILNENEEDVTSFFTNVTTVSGTLTVTQAEVTVRTGSASKEYDGTALTSTEADITGLADGETATVTATGSQTEVGESENTYTIDWGTADSGNYTIAEELGRLTVTENTTAITITAASATKPYDGKPLISPTTSRYTVDGLPDGFFCEADVRGSQTDAGTGRNEITSYAIRDKNSNDVTSSFTSISVVSGTLKVTPAEATVRTGSAEKEYDGTALTNAEAYIEGLVDGETASVTATGSLTNVGQSDNTYAIDWESAKSGNYTIKESLGTLEVTPAEVTVRTGSASKEYDGTALTSTEADITGLADGETASVIATGSWTDVGISDNFYVIDWGTADSGNYTIKENLGTLTVTTNTTAITITAASATKPYDGKPLTKAGYTFEGLPDGFTCGADVSGSQTSVGFSDSGISSYVILNENEEDVTSFFTNVTTVSGTLTVTQAEVTVWTGSASKEYDGTALTNAEAYITGLADGETATVTAIGSLTDVGLSDNIYSIDWGKTDSGSYTIKEELGSLQVKLNMTVITITSADGEMRYRGGRTLENHEYTVSGLPEGFTADATVTGMQWEVGSSQNTISEYSILKDSEVVTANFGNVQLVEGTLTVGKAIVDVWSDNYEKVYDGTPATGGQIYWKGIYNKDDPLNGINVYRGDTLTDAGSIEDTLQYEWNNADLADKYEVNLKPGTITVKKAELIITTGTKDKTYDGTPLTCAEAEHSGLAMGETIGISTTGSITDVGSVKNTYTIEWGDANPSNYDITENIGTLSILPRTLTVTSGSDSKIYDGGPLVCHEYEAKGLVDGETIQVNFTGSRTEPGSSENEFSVVWDTAKQGNYTLVCKYGTLTVQEGAAIITGMRMSKAPEKSGNTEDSDQGPGEDPPAEKRDAGEDGDEKPVENPPQEKQGAAEDGDKAPVENPPPEKQDVSEDRDEASGKDPSQPDAPDTAKISDKAPGEDPPPEKQDVSEDRDEASGKDPSQPDAPDTTGISDKVPGENPPPEKQDASEDRDKVPGEDPSPEKTDASEDRGEAPGEDPPSDVSGTAENDDKAPGDGAPAQDQSEKTSDER